MADFTFINSGAGDIIDDARILKPTSNTNITPSFTDTIARLNLPHIPAEVPLSGNGLSSSTAVIPPTGRPHAGQLWPRGVYNK